jgi:hypothetical protein
MTAGRFAISMLDSDALRQGSASLIINSHKLLVHESLIAVIR